MKKGGIMYLYNTELLFTQKLYGIAKSNNDKEVCYINIHKDFDFDVFFSKFFSYCMFISMNSVVKSFNYNVDNDYFLYFDIFSKYIRLKKHGLQYLESSGVGFFVAPVYFYTNDHSITFDSTAFTVDCDNFCTGCAGFFVMQYVPYKNKDKISILQSFIEYLSLYINGFVFDFTVFDVLYQNKEKIKDTRIIDPSEIVDFINDNYFLMDSKRLIYKDQLRITV